MKYIRLIIILLFSLDSFAQDNFSDWNTSEDCHINAQDNTPEYVREYRKPPREATVKVTFNEGCDCTGTIINRNTDDNNLGFYLLTARHCISDGESPLAQVWGAAIVPSQLVPYRFSNFINFY